MTESNTDSENSREKLDWQADSDGVRLRAFDQTAGYVIVDSGNLGFDLIYFPAPGPGVTWQTGLPTVQAAKDAAIDCAMHIARIRREQFGLE